jgi:hypothetical protein
VDGWLGGSVRGLINTFHMRLSMLCGVTNYHPCQLNTDTHAALGVPRLMLSKGVAHQPRGTCADWHGSLKDGRSNQHHAGVSPAISAPLPPKLVSSALPAAGTLSTLLGGSER